MGLCGLSACQLLFHYVSGLQAVFAVVPNAPGFGQHFICLLHRCLLSSEDGRTPSVVSLSRDLRSALLAQAQPADQHLGTSNSWRLSPRWVHSHGHLPFTWSNGFKVVGFVAIHEMHLPGCFGLGESINGDLGHKTPWRSEMFACL